MNDSFKKVEGFTNKLIDIENSKRSVSLDRDLALIEYIQIETLKGLLADKLDTFYTSDISQETIRAVSEADIEELIRECEKRINHLIAQ